MTLLERRLFTAFTLLCAQSCGDPAPRPEPPAGPAPVVDAGPVWYHRARLLDVTGDGRADSLDLQARRRTSDSSVFTFRVIVDGKVAFTDSWSSDYELMDPPPEAATPAGRDSLLRASLDTTLSRIRVSAIDTAAWSGEWDVDGDDCMDEPRNCVAMEFRERRAQVDWTKVHRDSVAAVYRRVSRAAFDTAAVLRIAGEMRRPGALQFTLSYGYETTMRLAWSPGEQEVFVIFACC